MVYSETMAACWGTPLQLPDHAADNLRGSALDLLHGRHLLKRPQHSPFRLLPGVNPVAGDYAQAHGFHKRHNFPAFLHVTGCARDVVKKDDIDKSCFYGIH